MKDIAYETTKVNRPTDYNRFHRTIPANICWS